MYTLPRDQRITIRRPTKLERAVVTRMHPWQGDRLSVLFSDRFTIYGSSRVECVHLQTGKADVLQLDGLLDEYGPYRRRRGQPYDIPPGLAFLVPTHGNSERVLMINRWIEDAGDVELISALDVMRDAVQEGDATDLIKATLIGSEYFPHSYGLFMALIRKEMTMLQGIKGNMRKGI